MSQIDTHTQKSIEKEFTRLIKKHKLSYYQTKRLMTKSRQNVGLKAEPQKTIRMPLSQDDLNKFLNQSYKEGATKGLICKTLYYTGARVSEFCDIKIDDFYYSENSIAIVGKKTGEIRICPIPEFLSNELYVHLNGRTKGYLFESKQHDKFTTRRIQQIVKEISEKAGINQPVYPHLFRHTIATTLINNGMPIDHVQKFLGHKEPKTTQIYAKLAVQTVKDSYHKAVKAAVIMLVCIFSISCTKAEESSSDSIKSYTQSGSLSSVTYNSSSKFWQINMSPKPSSVSMLSVWIVYNNDPLNYSYTTPVWTYDNSNKVVRISKYLFDGSSIDSNFGYRLDWIVD